MKNMKRCTINAPCTIFEGEKIAHYLKSILQFYGLLKFVAVKAWYTSSKLNMLGHTTYVCKKVQNFNNHVNALKKLVGMYLPQSLGFFRIRQS